MRLIKSRPPQGGRLFFCKDITMFVDSFFKIGTTHPVCEDYARTGQSGYFDFARGPKQEVYAIISDGCSSARDSDLGARLLTMAAEYYVYRSSLDAEGFGQSVIGKAQSFAGAMGLPIQALNATLMVAHVEHNNIVVRVFGDGVVASRTKGGQTNITQIEFSGGAPYYLQYEIVPDKQGYIDQFGGKYTLTQQTIGIEGTVEGYGQTKMEVIPCIKFVYDLDKVEFVAIMSDGAAQFTKPMNSGTVKKQKLIDLSVVVKEFLNFKPTDNPNFTGTFVQRRCRRVFKDHPEWQNTDDFSIAVIGKEK